MKYIGMDVSKVKLDCCLLHDASGAKRKNKVVDNSVLGVNNLLAFIDKEGIARDDVHVVMEGIPGVGPEVGHRMLSVMRNHHFRTAEQLAAYLGLVPIERQSGSCLHARPKISKAGPGNVRAVMYLPAVSAKRWNPHIRALAQRLEAKGKSPKAIVVAAMRKLVHLCFGVLKSKTPYAPDHAQPA